MWMGGRWAAAGCVNKTFSTTCQHVSNIVAFLVVVWSQLCDQSAGNSSPGVWGSVPSDCHLPTLILFTSTSNMSSFLCFFLFRKTQTHITNGPVMHSVRGCWPGYTSTPLS